jgi:hypothetical protein
VTPPEVFTDFTAAVKAFPWACSTSDTVNSVHGSGSGRLVAHPAVNNSPSKQNNLRMSVLF